MSETNKDSIPVQGIYEPVGSKSGQLVSLERYGKPRHTDPFIAGELIKRFKIKRGSLVTGFAFQDKKHPNPRVKFVDSIDGMPVDQRKKLIKYDQLTTIPPQERIALETKDGRLTTRIIDLFCPIGKGQRGLIVAPPRTGKTTLLQDIAYGALENNPKCHLMVLLVDERPEEVTDFKRSVPAEIFASSNDESLENHIHVADFAIERAKRLVEIGKDVILLIDSITRLARAHNSAKGGGGRTMTGGLDIRALERPRQVFSAARNTEEAGSLTIIASALIETGSKMDELIFQEFKGTGNMEMVLDRQVAELRHWPAINLAASGTRREELLLSEKELHASGLMRRGLAPMKVVDAAEALIERMSKTKTNADFLKLFKS
jgi:transcription termination factor Rho